MVQWLFNFVCPACSNSTLEVVASLALGPDADDHEQSLQAVRCSSCGLEGAAVYREMREATVEEWGHFGGTVDEETYAELVQALERCPRPDAPHCGCATHKHFDVLDEEGYRDALQDVLDDDAPRFALQPVPRYPMTALAS